MIRRSTVEFDKLLAVLASLHEQGVEYVLIGAAALNVHNIVRATDDAAIFLRPTVVNVARLRDALRAGFDDPEIEKITADDLLGEYPAVQYVSPTAEFQLDVVTRLGEAFGYNGIRFEVIDVQGSRFGSRPRPRCIG